MEKLYSIDTHSIINQSWLWDYSKLCVKDSRMWYK